MILKPIIFAVICFITLFANAEQIGDIHFNAKILSFNQKTVQIETSGQKYEIPRTTLKTGKLEIGQDREIAMSKADYQQMKSQAMYRNSSKAKGKTKESQP